MAVISNLSTLETAIADYLARDDLTSFIPNFIQSVEDRVYRQLKHRHVEKALSIDVSSGVAAVPTDFLALKHAYYDVSPARMLRWVTLDELYDEYPNRGEVTAAPCLIAREADNFIFGPVAADGTAILKGVYYEKLDPLRTTDSSWYVVNMPQILLYGALIEAGRFIQDDAIVARFEPLYAEAIRAVEDEERLSAQSQGMIRQRAL